MPNVKIKIRNGSGWEQIHPETNLSQIVDMTPGGRNIASLANPTTTGLVKLEANGTASITAMANIREEIGAAATTHPHVQSHIDGLVSALAGKADLSGGKIISTQIPDWIIGGLKFVSPAVSGATLTLDATFRSTYGMTDDIATKGRYVIISAASCTVTLTANHIVTTGDEGVTGSGIILEQGDWIVYRGKNGGNYEFDVVNNNYQVASTEATGVVQLSSGVVTSRGGLSASSDPTKVMDEFAVRQVLKGIYYESSEAAVSSPLQNDLLFEIVS